MDASTVVPLPVNEPVRSYAPGSPERAGIQARLKELSATPVELIDPAVFRLTNQYWVSYYRDRQIFDRKFLFVPDSIVPENFSRLELLDGQAGVLHG